MAAPLIVIVGRVSPEADNVRGEAFASGQRYSRAVERAGGIPLVLPPLDGLTDARLHQLIARVDGALFHGGGDIDPARYGQEATGEGLFGIIPEHDDVELALMRAAVDADLPTLAVCRGAQVLNVTLGGTLVQDIGTEDHWRQHAPVTLTPGSRVAAAFGTTRPLRCHHVHHQSLDRLGEGLIAVGHADDGMLEAVELDRARWIVGVQWHPEDDADGDPEQQAVFDELVRQARPS